MVDSKNIEFVLNDKALNINNKKTNDNLQLTDFSSIRIGSSSHHGVKSGRVTYSEVIPTNSDSQYQSSLQSTEV